MRSARPIALAILAAAASGCTCSTAPGPEILAVYPSETPDHLDATLRIVGTGFAAEVRADFDDPGGSQVDGTFRAALVAGEARIELGGVALVSGEEIRATLPSGAALGTYDLEVLDPRGRTALLPGALEVFEAECLENGAPCEDADLCTAGDECLGFRCRPGEPVTCTPTDACHVAACDPDTGCSEQPAEDGTPCSVSGCPAGDSCQGGVCTPVPGGCQDTAPLARLTVRPGGGTAGETIFALDASASSDAEDAPSSLRFRFDAGEGLGFGALSAVPALDHVYLTPGIFQAAVEVLDPAGLSSFASAVVVVAAGGDEIPVTTAIDERDPDASPEAPGGAGLSLREAIEWVNSQGEAKVITMAAPLTVTMTGAQKDLVLTAPGAAVVAEPGVTLDFDGFNLACLVLDGPDQLLAGVSLRGCDSIFVTLSPGSHGSQVTQCSIGPGPAAIGVNGQADSPGGPPLPPPASLVGPGNDLAGLDTGVRLTGTDYAVVGNGIHHNSVGVVATGVRATLVGNRIHDNTGTSGPNVGTGLLVSQGPGPVTVLHGVFEGNGASGIAASTIPLVVRNSIFTRNESFGIDAPAGDFEPGALGPNGYHQNGAGPLSSLSPETGDVLEDPLFVNDPAGDFRLLPASPAVDAGLDTGLDVNGAGEASFWGAAPDLGAEESPY
jgi:hypothetical protein